MAFACLLPVASGCGSGSESSRPAALKVGGPEKPWSRADYNDPKGFWMSWRLDAPPSYGVGTRFDIEHVAADGTKTIETLTVTGIRPQRKGRSYRVDLQRGDGTAVRRDVPLDLPYTRGSVGYITVRNPNLVEVTVPAGRFTAARVYSTEAVGDETHDVDRWIGPDLPVVILMWSRRPRVDPYDPPEDAVIPLGKAYSRLVSIDRK
jgi:hypothetical protein